MLSGFTRVKYSPKAITLSPVCPYYANTLGMHISKTYPKVSAMIEAWKKQGGDSETLLSNLEKNQELKNVLLEETPWVLEAKANRNRNRNLLRCST